MAWFRRSDGEHRPEHEKLDDVEFKPEELKKDLETSIDAKLNDFSTKQQESMKPILEMAEAIKAERDARIAKNQEEARRKQQEESSVDMEDYLLDPAAATRKQLEPTNNAILALAARIAKQDTLADKEFYHGDIKAKVDALLSKQPLAAQSKADIIENTYKIIVFDHQKDIQDGKIKARNFAGAFEGSGTGAHSGSESKEGTEVLTAEEKEVAKRMNISEKDWAASKRELSYV